MEAETTEIVAGVAGEIAEVVTGIMTETGEAEVGEAGIGRAEDDLERPGDVQFKIAKNVEREREKQLDMEFPGEGISSSSDV